MTHLTLFDRPFSRLFVDPFFGLPAGFGDGEPGGVRWAPPVDVRDSDSEFRIEAELPGIPRDHLSVRFHDGRLTLEGHRDGGVETESGGEGGEPSTAPAGWTQRERITGKFRRIFEVPDTVDPSGIRAESKDGVLTVVLPKVEKAQPRQIEVSVH